MRATDAIVVKPEQDKIDVTALGELYEGRGDRLQIETAPGQDGYVGRMAVQASTPGTSPGWIVFALNNPTTERITRWLVAPRYSLANSRAFWPELDAPRVAAITPSLGFRPERMQSDRADMFRLSIDPGQTITYAAEMSSRQVPRLTLWDPEAYQAKLQDRNLFNGVLLGITGLLAIFLTAIFAANHRAIFPATALVAWAALAYFCIDFGFWTKLLPVGAEHMALYRAAAEAALAATLVLFLYAFLRIGLWHSWIKTLFWVWIAAQFALVAFALVDPRMAAGLARGSLVGVAAIGTCLVVYLALRGQDRALLLIPSWMLLLVWLFGAAMVVLGKLQGDFMIAGLAAGLVLILVLLGFTVTQFAFRSMGGSGALQLGPTSQVQMKSLAVDGSGAAVWQWNAGKDQITVAPEIEEALGAIPGTLDTTVDRFLQHMHVADRERFRLMLWSLQENQGGELQTEFRLKRQDGNYLWYELRARAAPSDNARLMRCVGLLRDITGLKRSHERLMHDAVHDSLTGLPNRELFLDRLQGALTRSREGQANRPTLMFIDIDRFKNVNQSFGLAVGDSMLLTLARRLSRHINPQDTIARLSGDQFAILMISETDPRQVATLAERVRRALRTPMKIGGKEIVLTASIGIVVDDGIPPTAQDVLREAEIAMLRAKRGGADRIEIFTASMRGEEESPLPLESELRKALERRQIAVLYQPITRLASNQLAGFEALLRWDHPSRGQLGADEFIPLAEETGLITELGSYVLSQALGRGEPLAQDAAARARSSVRQRQCLEPPAVPPGPRPGDQADAGAGGGAEGHAQARDHRIAGDGEPRARRRDPDLAQDLRREPGPRRFRHRLLLVELSPPLPVRHHQGRSLARSRHRAQRLDALDPALDHRARPRARQRGGGRRRRDRRGRGLSPLDRLRIRPGLLLRRADVAEGSRRPVVGARQPPQAAAARALQGARGGRGRAGRAAASDLGLRRVLNR